MKSWHSQRNSTLKEKKTKVSLEITDFFDGVIWIWLLKFSCYSVYEKPWCLFDSGLGFCCQIMLFSFTSTILKQVFMHSSPQVLTIVIHFISEQVVHPLGVYNFFRKLLPGCCSRKFYRITPIRISLHWLPVKFRKEFKS